MQQLEFQGITRIDVQQIFEATVKKYKILPRLMYFDASYLYTFDLDDIWDVRNFTDIIRDSLIYVWEENRWVARNPQAIRWHNFLERWLHGESVTIFDRPIRPKKIVRTIDRVPNEFMEIAAAAMAADQKFRPMKFHGLGDGATPGDIPSPADTQLFNEISRIDVTDKPGGGGITVDGSTFMCIGNHPISIETANLSEMGMWDRNKPGTNSDPADPSPVIDDRMGDHSIFPAAIFHGKNADAPGGTIIVFQCSS